MMQDCIGCHDSGGKSSRLVRAKESMAVNRKNSLDGSSRLVWPVCFWSVDRIQVGDGL